MDKNTLDQFYKNEYVLQQESEHASVGTYDPV